MSDDVDSSEVYAALVDTWTEFTLAIQPAEICIERVTVGSVPKARGVVAGGTYNPVTKVIRIDDDSDGRLAAETLRHELCHAWHHQVLRGTPPEEVFFFGSDELDWERLDRDLAGWSSRMKTKEAFAFTCQLEPSSVIDFARTECGTGPPQAALDYTKQRVYSNVNELDEFHVETVLDVQLSTVLDGTPTKLQLVEELVAGHLVVFVELGKQADLVLINLATGEVKGTSGHLADKPRLKTPPPMALVDTPKSVTKKLGAAFGNVEGGVFSLSTPMGAAAWPFIREGGPEGRWHPVSGACEMLVDSPESMATFFVAESGTALWSAALEGDRFKVFDWSGAVQR